MSYGALSLGLCIFAFLIFEDIFPQVSTERGSIFVVDVSLSMSVEDMSGESSIRFSRLQAVQNILKNIPDTSPKALMTFAENTKLQLPLSRGDIVWDEVVEALEPIRYGASTDINTALATTLLIYPDRPLDIYIFTDGEQTMGSSTATGIMISESMRIHMIGVGSSEGGKIINNYDGEGRIVYKKFESKDIISKLDKTSLERFKDMYDTTLTFLSDPSDSEKVLAFIDSNQIQQTSPFPMNRIYYGIAGFLVLAGLMIPYYQRK